MLQGICATEGSCPIPKPTLSVNLSCGYRSKQTQIQAVAKARLRPCDYNIPSELSCGYRCKQADILVVAKPDSALVATTLLSKLRVQVQAG